MAADYDTLDKTMQAIDGHSPPNARPLLEELKRKCGFVEDFHVDWMLNEIDMAVMWYHIPALPTHRNLLPAVKRAGRLAAELEKALHAAWPLRPHGDGALEALQQIQEEAARLAAAIEKNPPHRGRHSPLWEWVARMMYLYEQGAGRRAGYTWDEPASAYAGDFMGFVRTIAAAWDIKASDSAIVDQIQRHRRDPILLDTIRDVGSNGTPD